MIEFKGLATLLFSSFVDKYDKFFDIGFSIRRWKRCWRIPDASDEPPGCPKLGGAGFSLNKIRTRSRLHT